MLECENKYYPSVGNYFDLRNSEKENKYRFQYLIDAYISNPKIDMYLTQFGERTFLYLFSPKALKEFESLVPRQIDRDCHKSSYIQKVVNDSFALMPSNSKWELRRKEILQTK